ncbi:MAG TPA: hypothetical protein VNW92_02995 [Polyangiaceae bacterium]|nr:hypothetical protein [Polyangiaceae bacterium]
MKKVAQLATFAPLLVACNPVFDDRFSAVDSPRVLAVQSTPAQVAPNKAVSYQLLVVDSRGTVASPQVDWSFCTQAKPINELNDVASACFGTGDRVQPFAMGDTAKGKLPSNACSQFGPDLPETMPGAPSARPTDADTTGGYYQPVILAVHDAGQTIETLAETRITCGLANSTGQQFEDYQRETKTNENPELSSVVVTSMGDAPLTDVGDAAPLTIQHGTEITLRASWPACPTTPVCGDGMCTSGEAVADCPDDCTTPVGCRGPEEYAYLDPAQGSLVDRHESMRVSWFATDGEFADDHTGRLEEEFAVTSSDDPWRAPATPGTVFMWVVLRDDRGGVDYHSFQVQVE